MWGYILSILQNCSKYFLGLAFPEKINETALAEENWLQSLRIVLALLSVLAVLASPFGLKDNVNATGACVENAEAVFEQILKTPQFSINSHWILKKNFYKTKPKQTNRQKKKPMFKQGSPREVKWNRPLLSLASTLRSFSTDPGDRVSKDSPQDLCSHLLSPNNYPNMQDNFRLGLRK